MSILVALLLCSNAALAQTGLLIDDPITWAWGQERPIKPAKLLASEQWQSYKSNLVASEGHYARAKVAYYEPRMAEIVTQSNKAFDTARKLKGAAVERFMDAFYAKDGWEKLPSKVGPQGIDGLYVKRSPNGRILPWFVADAKSGTSKLGMTKYGEQLSPEWIEQKLQELKAAYSKNPTPENLRNLEDVSALKPEMQRASREFRVEIRKNADGNPVCRITQKYIDGSLADAITDIDLVKNTPMRTMVLKMYEDSAIYDFGYSAADAKKIVRDLEKGFKDGSVTCDSDVYKCLAKAKKANAVEDYLMDDFYAKDGWEKLTSKVGPQGIDGLYVKRSPEGRILLWFVAETKSGISKLGMIKYGKQLSPEWIDKKLQALETAYSKNPTPANLRNLEDMRALKTATQRAPREFQPEIMRDADGKIVCRITQTCTRGSRAITVTDIDMTKVKNNPMRRMVLDCYEKSAIEDYGYSVVKAKEIVKTLDEEFRKRTIACDADAVRALKKSIPTTKCGFPAMKYAGPIAIASEISLIVANDLSKEGLSKQTAYALASYTGVAVGVPAVIHGAGVAAQHLSRWGGASMGMAKTVGGVTTKTLGGVFGAAAVGLGAYQIYDFVSEYYAGNISQQEMLVKTTLTAIPLVAFAVGEKFGLKGMAIAAGVGLLCGGAWITYDDYIAEERKALSLEEERYWARMAEKRLLAQ